MDASPIFPLTLLLFFPGGLTLQSFEAVRSSEPFTLLLYNCPNDGALAASSIRRIIKRAMRRAGLDDAVARELSGHSMRIGAAQDMMAAGFDALAIMQAGGVESANVVLRYVERAATRELHEKRWRSTLLQLR